MRHDRLWAAAISMCLRRLRCHCEGFARICHLFCSVGNTCFWPALVDMLVEAGRVLRHGRGHQKWRDDRYCDDVFQSFSPAFFESARYALSFQPRLQAILLFSLQTVNYDNI